MSEFGSFNDENAFDLIQPTLPKKHEIFSFNPFASATTAGVVKQPSFKQEKNSYLQRELAAGL
jgi:hypothetical protein